MQAAQQDCLVGWKSYTTSMIMKGIASIGPKDRVKLRTCVLSAEKLFKDSLKEDFQSQVLPAAFVR
jgi:hypothetical protein